MFELFQDYHWTSLEKQQYEMTEKQIQYITQPIPILHMHQRLKMNLNKTDYRQLDYIYRIALPKAKVRDVYDEGAHDRNCGFGRLRGRNDIL